ncbi:MAG: inositol-3-phosphate synthase, partial [Actinomycetota bacterium]|nr:inositol-3-phosphate synthase [Actinomycetota bacterium]
AVRLIKLALNSGISGQLDGPSSYLMKSPHTQRPDADAREQTEDFIAAHARKAHGDAAPKREAEAPAEA